jgi:hypothetical protein
VGLPNCLLCDSGKFADRNGTTECEQCAAGR